MPNIFSNINKTVRMKTTSFLEKNEDTTYMKIF